MKNFFKYIFLFVLIPLWGLGGFGCGACYAQLYPVQLTPVFNSPYSLKLSDYATSMDAKMQLLINPTDISINNRQVRLKFSVQGNGINAKSIDFIQGENSIFINGGELQTLTNVDIAALFRLENLQGISAVQYANPLPEGMYNFCFEMYDFVTNQKISQKSCSMLYLILNDPPLLNTPQRNEQIAASDFPNILFTWTPRQINATNVSYTYELKELLDPSLDPQYGFQMAPLLYQETDLHSTAMVYDLGKPNLIPGKRYAWRVRAISTSGLSENSVFKNDGYSEIFSFKYTGHCQAPTFLLSEAQGPKSVKITWEGIPEHTRYQLQYKKQDVRNAQWFSTNSLNTQSLITNLEPGVTYQFRVGSSCDSATEGIQSFTYSGISTFTTPTETNGVKAYNCGITPKISIQNQKPIDNLIQSETFAAGDFPVTILELSGHNPYSGKGYIIVPYLADTKIAVEFKDIIINTDYQLINGIIETSYNPDWKNVTDLEDFTGEGQGGQIEETVPFEVKEIIVNENGGLVVNGISGEQITIPGGKDTVITDSKGNTFNVDKDGNGSNIPTEPALGGKSTPSNTDGVDKNGQVTEFTAKGISIVFSNKEDTNNGPKSQYAFDVMPKEAPKVVQKLYAKVGDVALPYKAVVNGDTDTLLAAVNVTDANIKLDSIVFKTQNGAKVDFKRNDKTFVLTVKGSFSYAEEQILATIKQGDKWKVIGAFMLVHISPKEVNVVLVPLNKDTQIPVKAEENLQSTYKTAGIKLNITRSAKVDYSDADRKIEVGDSDFLASYTAEEQTINQKIKSLSDYKTNAYYLIYSDLPASNGSEGFMALKGQFGYVFSNDKTKTVAHELGHGTLGLEHPFKTKAEEKKTNFLMDYGDGIVLWHNDWKQINDPKFRLYMFQEDSEGEYETDGHYSTVYLVSLMLGMNPEKALELAKATEAPDTTIHNDTKFELNDTWSKIGLQTKYHALTGGFHGIEEFLTAINFLYTSNGDIKKQGELLHRFGDTYAHSKIGNLVPEDIKEPIRLKDADSLTISKYIASWKLQSMPALSGKVEPWIQFFSYYIEKYGLEFLSNQKLQKSALQGKTLATVLKDLYLKNPSDNFIMYGGDPIITFDHAKSDGAYPDQIYLRPNWYYFYVQNLSWLISEKYGFDNSKLELPIFNKMVNFVSKNKCSMKGIIDYEIAKKLNKKVFYIPVFYSNPNKFWASYDAVINSDYFKIANEIVEKTKKYMIEQGISEDQIKVEEINDWFAPKINVNGVFVTQAYKIIY